MLPKWTVTNNYFLAELEENTSNIIPLPLETTTGITTSVISGSLPGGMRLENNQIIGIPFEVSRPTTSEFVIRASSAEGIIDRTFYILVNGSDDPVWITPAGRLPIGNNNTFFILDNTLIDFQLLADDPDLPAGDELKFYLSGGELPPGISLTPDGRLFGIVDPLLALDINVINGGFDSNRFSQYPYDFAEGLNDGDRIPRKLNRDYNFRITVTDNVNFVNRTFQIFVVGDDFARADNTIMKAGTGVFTADFTYLRVPLWLTPSDLGIRRANNYLTIYLEALDTNTLEGELRYLLETTNEDGSPSIVPPGLVIDSMTGELAGVVPYQPAITRTYNFTVNAIRVGTERGIITIFGSFLEDVLSGKNSFKLQKVPRDFIEGLDELQSLLNRSITIENNSYFVTNVDTSNPNFDLITVSSALLPSAKANPLRVVKTASGQNYFFVNSLSQADKNFYFRRNLIYSNNESYRIDDIFEYVEWNINSGGIINLSNGVPDNLMEDSLKSQLDFFGRSTTVNITRNGNDDVIAVNIIAPSTAQSRSSSFIRDLFVTDDSQPVTVNQIGQYDRILLNTPLTRTLDITEEISISLPRGDQLSVSIARTAELALSKKKQFTIKLLGEIDSTIFWLTPTNLGSLIANRTSTISVRAESTATGSLIRYELVSGSLPPGLRLTTDGEIIGRVPITGTVENPGVLNFDNRTTTFDFGTTSFDRSYTFTILAKDRFEYSAIERTFTLLIDDRDNLNYSNIYFKPFLKENERNNFLRVLDNSKTVPPEMIYRASDPNFGLQKSLKSLVFAGIENLELEQFVSATAKNHKKKNFQLGEIKNAIAKRPGTNEIVYEIVYIELIDSAKPIEGKTKKDFIINDPNKILVNSIKYEDKDSNVNGGFLVTLRDESIIRLSSKNLPITLRNNDQEVVFTNAVPYVTTQANTIAVLNSATNISEEEFRLRPWKFRPKGNTITSDSNAIKASQSKNVKKYISNIDNMRDNIRALGRTNREFLPLWMRTAQEGSLNEIGYSLVLPLVYTKPGFSQTIKENLQNSNFDFKSLNFEIDRYIIDSTQGIEREQYILFANYQFNV